MTGEIVAETVVTIRSTGSLDGNVMARSINVEKGGTFSGQLMIGPKETGARRNCCPDVESTEPRDCGSVASSTCSILSVLPATS